MARCAASKSFWNVFNNMFNILKGGGVLNKFVMSYCSVSMSRWSNLILMQVMVILVNEPLDHVDFVDQFTKSYLLRC